MWSGSAPTPGRSGGRVSRRSLLAAAAATVSLAAAAYRDGPPPGRTGGFGEPTCVECHLPGAPPEPAARLAVCGAPEAWKPGRAYRLTVAIARPGLERAGFQAAMRFASGTHAGRAAGRLAPTDGRAAVVPDAATGVAYVQHTRQGTLPTAPGSATWILEWTAPVEPAGKVVLHVAGNAADDDDSPLGDEILSTSLEIPGPD